MVKHVVLFKLQAQESAEKKLTIMQEIKSQLEALLGKVEALKSIEVGLNENPNEQFDIVLITTHDDMEGLKAYAVHPEHVKVAQVIGQYKEDRSCVDFTI